MMLNVIFATISSMIKM